MSKITIYTNETCPYCKEIKEKLIEKKLEFENKLTKDYIDEYQEIVNLTGIPSIPIIKYMEEYFIPGRDFQNADQLMIKLETFKISPYNEKRKIYEQIKTLNYHTNMAFGRMDQLLRQIENKLNTKEDEHKSTN